MPQFIRLGFFLALRQMRRASKWTTGLIIFVMTLTFLNLVVVSGILVGLIEGAVEANKEFYTSDVILSTLEKKNFIEQSPQVLNIVNAMPETLAVSARYLSSGNVEVGYKTATKEEEIDTAGAPFVGINPADENNLTGISRFVIDGEYLTSEDYDQVLLGSYLLTEYFPVETASFPTLDDVGVGDKIRITIGELQREMTVKGIVKSKVDELSYRVYFVDTQFRDLIGRNDYNVGEISVRLKPGTDPSAFKESLLRSGVGEYARVQTFEDAQPKFLQDIKDTFALLGNLISSVGLVVASITIFIVIFINAITRRKFIGILKGVGISGKTIELSYVFQSFFYAACGSIIGLFLLYGFLEPFIRTHPINFPFSDGILVAPLSGTLIKIAILMVTTIIAGYIPARMIVRKNTLDSILGRN
ncbi:MAG: FtsX-like permease family protein [Patescibacteria group bacterium]